MEEEGSMNGWNKKKKEWIMLKSCLNLKSEYCSI